MRAADKVSHNKSLLGRRTCVGGGREGGRAGRGGWGEEGEKLGKGGGREGGECDYIST